MVTTELAKQQSTCAEGRRGRSGRAEGAARATPVPSRIACIGTGVLSHLKAEAELWTLLLTAAAAAWEGALAADVVAHVVVQRSSPQLI